jgi:hypothetical protein
VDFTVTSTAAANGEVTVRLTTKPASRVQSVTLRAENLTVDRPTRAVAASAVPVTIEWKGRLRSAMTPWVAVVIPDGDVSRRREVVPSPDLTRR